ncbi:MAG: hypothetical protein IPN71_02360 [Fibrobacteres bacterium]|jgi:hypothetical protein|nr:hypothetical protein [Fibrobacterota bacterium]
MEESIQTKSVYISESMFSGIQDGKPYATVRRDAIETIHLKRGAASKHPGIQLVIGLCFVALGGLLAAGRSEVSEVLVAGLMSLPIGGLLIYDVLKRRWFFEILHRGGREIVVLPDCDARQAAALAEEATLKFGYRILI